MRSGENKTTEQLLNDISERADMQEYLSENESEMKGLSLSAYLNAMLRVYPVKKADLFRRAGLDGNNYCYELFQNDNKKPSRDLLLRICLSFPLSIEETQLALRNAGLAILYPRDMRDAYILFALKNRLGIDELNSLLYERKMKVLD